MAMQHPGRAWLFVGAAALVGAGTAVSAWSGAAPARRAGAPGTRSTAAHVAPVDQYGVTGHDEDEKKGNLALDSVVLQDVSKHPDVWEKVVRKLRARQMPPIGTKKSGENDRPDEATYDAVIASLEGSLDRAAAAH